MIDFGKTVSEAACAKVNLSLDVIGLRPDGYHELCSVMNTISLCDDVHVTLRESAETDAVISVSGYSECVPQDGQNTAAAAALRFFEALGLSGCTAEIEIKKRIPVGAGLGGGSADAAAVLRALNSICGEPFHIGQLREIGARVGADVPFCIEGGTMLARGIGEILSPLPPLPECAMIIVKPDFSISTAELYRKIDTVEITHRPDTEGLISALRAHDLNGVARLCSNVFEEALINNQRVEIDLVKSRLLELGALSAVMTGTGSAVFGIFEGCAGSLAALDILSKDYQCFCCIS